MKRFIQRQGRQISSPSRITRCLLSLEHLETRVVPAVVPAFSSLPGANHTIYLDFDGHVSQNTQWNANFNNPTINSPAYDRDGSPSIFNATELADIESAWNRMAEDFIPFNVNVTTVDPGVNALIKSGPTDTQWGIRVIITSDTQGTGAGGIAFINSFNWNADTGVFVYVTGGKNIAEAGSHEVGHSLGLGHDGTPTAGYYTGHGTGETSWASLMGVGYYTNVTTWDKGEYFGSNNAGANANYNRGPDDLSIITTFNGFGYRPDDVGNTTATSTALSVAGTSVSGSGMIGTTSDVDFFSFTTGAGSVSFNLNPFATGPNLDIKADLYNSSGGLVATSNQTSTLSASFNLILPAGQYFIKVDGTGFGTPGANPPTGYSDYASLGRYTIAGTIVQPATTAQFSVNDLTVNEAAGTATFTVTLTGSISSNAIISYATANGSAIAPGDYTSTSGTLTFVPGGSTTQTVTVSIIDDTLTEPSETFSLNLTNPIGAVILDGQGVATILDNDVGTTLSVAVLDAIKAEGTKKGVTPFTFTVTRSGNTTGSSTVNWAVTGLGGIGFAATTGDFENLVFPSGTTSFAPGETSQVITANVLADSVVENNEYFRVTLTNAVGAVVTGDIADGIILNDDSGRPTFPPTGDKFPLPGQENQPGFQHDHDHEHNGGSAPATTRQQLMQALITQLVSRLEGHSNPLAGTFTASTRSLSTVTTTRLDEVKSRMQSEVSLSIRTMNPTTLKALTSSASSSRGLNLDTSLVDKVFAMMKSSR